MNRALDTKTEKEFLTTLGERLSYAGYPIGTNILSMLGLTYLSLFYTDFAGLSTGVVAALFLAARIWDAVNDPLFGGIVDRINPKKGKFKPWVSATIIALPVATIFVFRTIEGGGMSNIIYACITYIIWGMIGTVCGVPFSAMVTSLTDKLSERATLISWSTFTGILGSVLTAVLGGPMIKKFGFQNTVLILVTIAFITMIPVHFLAKERVLHPRRDRVTFKNMLDAIVRNRYLIAFFISYLFLTGTSFAMTIGTYFVKWNLGNLELMGIVMISSFLPVVILPLLLPMLIRRFGKRKLYLYGILLGIVFSVVQYFAGYRILPLFLLLNGIKLIGIYLPVTMTGMFTADCAEYGAYITGKRNEGITFAIQAFSNKLGGAVSGALSMLLLGLSGYNGMAEVQTQTTLDSIWLQISLLPVTGLVIAFVIFSRFYKLEEQDVEKMITGTASHKEFPVQDAIAE